MGEGAKVTLHQFLYYIQCYNIKNMKKTFLIIFALLVVMSIVIFLRSQYTQMQKTEARMQLDTTFGILDDIKDNKIGPSYL